MDLNGTEPWLVSLYIPVFTQLQYFLPKWLLGKKVYCSHILLKHKSRQTHTHTYKDTSRGVSSPTALFLSGEVDLEVVWVIVDVKETAALIKLTNTLDRGVDTWLKVFLLPLFFTCFLMIAKTVVYIVNIIKIKKKLLSKLFYLYNNFQNKVLDKASTQKLLRLKLIIINNKFIPDAFDGCCSEVPLMDSFLWWNGVFILFIFAQLNQQLSFNRISCSQTEYMLLPPIKTVIKIIVQIFRLFYYFLKM